MTDPRSDRRCHIRALDSRLGDAVRIEPVLITGRLANDLDVVAVLREAVDERDDAGRAQLNSAV